MTKRTSDTTRFWNKVERQAEGCWLWTAGTRRDGYGTFYDGRTQAAHRWAWEQENGPIPEGLFIRHTCDTRLCVRPSHMILGTHQQNMGDMVQRRRSAYGTRNASAVLDEAAAVSIRQRLIDGTTRRQIAAEYGITPQAVGLLARRKTWRHVA